MGKNFYSRLNRVNLNVHMLYTVDATVTRCNQAEQKISLCRSLNRPIDKLEFNQCNVCTLYSETKSSQNDINATTTTYLSSYATITMANLLYQILDAYEFNSALRLSVPVEKDKNWCY